MAQPLECNPSLKPTYIGVADGKDSEVAWRQMEFVGTDDANEVFV